MHWVQRSHALLCSCIPARLHVGLESNLRLTIPLLLSHSLTLNTITHHTHRCISAVLGAHLGVAMQDYPICFTGFVSFGIAALLHLVVNELLVDARRTMAGQEQWWSSAVLFLGLYAVMLMDAL